jgi:ketosteroid isomerase-like protein
MSAAMIERMNGAIGRRDIEAFLNGCAADAVWEHNPGGGSPEEGVYEGRDEIRHLFERILDGFEFLELAPREMNETAPGVWLVRGELRWKIPSAATEMTVPYEQQFETRDELMTRGRMTFGGQL